jgi:hypothetical protein
MTIYCPHPSGVNNKIYTSSVFKEIENMKPMAFNSTPFILYQDIKVQDIDIFEDAWGFNSEFNDVIDFLGKLKVVPGQSLTKTLIEKIRKQV